MSAMFAYFYFMEKEPEQIRNVAPTHHEYWKQQHLDGYRGGPFDDRSGGLITFEATSLEAAQRLVDGDPFKSAGLLKTHWVKHWSVR